METPCKTFVKQWKPLACPCAICKSYIVRVGYIKVSDYYSISITALKHLRKELEILKIRGISVLSIFIVYVPYLCRLTISRLFYDFCNVYFRFFYSPNGPSM